jgi:hypothetical protein
MNEKQTRQVALLGSIKHWIENANAEYRSMVSVISTSCACCEIWNNRRLTEAGRECIGCPIYDFTGKTFCIDTPYHKASEANTAMYAAATSETSNNVIAALLKFKVAARKEVKFLMKVLKKELK